MALMPRGADWTVDDLDRPPDDGLRYELLDGTLIVSPSPTHVHQRVVRKLSQLLDAACPPDLEVFFAPLDWQPDRRNSLVPDVLVLDPERFEQRAYTDAPLLVVEVLSPSSRQMDRLVKRAKYEAGRATGDEALEAPGPFGVTVVPRALVTR